MYDLIAFVLQWIVAPYLFIGAVVYVGLAFLDLQDIDEIDVAVRWPAWLYYLIVDAVRQWRS